tara:strand:+ start:870 stop:2942 length:2073 start_codon:yes stop_codon:yes gene_type:complete
MNHNIQKVLSYLGIFSKRLGVFASFAIIMSFMSFIFFSSEDNLFADEESVIDKITFIAFDINYKESDFSFSKDILSHIVKFQSLDSSEKIILKPYGNKSYPSLEIKKDEIDLKLDEFFKNLPYESSDSASNHYLVISEGFTKIAELSDTSKSNFYLISNLKLSNSEDSSEMKLRNLSDLYLSSKIKLNVMSLPSSNSSDRDLFESFSQNTGGDFIDFDSESIYSFVNFMKTFMDQPNSILQTNLSSKPLSNFVNVPPTVSKQRLAIYRENTGINISIIDPNGIEINSNQGLDFWSLDNIIYLDIDDPESGTWTIISTGDSGRLEIISDTENPLRLETYGQKIYPVGSEIILEVGAYIENLMLNISDAEMQVRIRDANGTETIQIMNDLGQKNDQVPFDGIYTASLPSINNQSIIDVEYTLQWKNMTTPVVKNDQIKIEYFPDLQLTKIHDLRGKNKKDFLVATFETKVNNYPFLVGLDEIIYNFSDENNYTFRIDPVKLQDTDKSYIFDVYMSSNEKIKETLFIDLSLSTLYLDESYESVSKKIQINVNTNYLYIFGLRYYYLLLFLAILAIFTLLILNNIRQTKIEGFLIDVQNNIVVDFSSITRNPIEKFLYPKRIRFDSIKQLPYSGGFFEFDAQKVFMEINPKDGDPSIRINSIPANSRNEITDGPWIGSSGKQVRFKRTIPYLEV